MTAPTVAEILATVKPPKGRADLSNAQKLQLAHVLATVELAREQRIANLLRLISGPASAYEHDKGTRASTDDTRARVAWRNDARAEVRDWMAEVGE